MRSQAQYTIHALNDIETSATAPLNPYLGQVWEDTSTSPPTMKVWNGTAWKEQNGTDTIKTNVTNLTTKANTLETNLNGLTSTVSAVTSRVTTVENGLGEVEETVEDLSSDVSTLQQTTTEIIADVSNKVDNEYGSVATSFGWKLKSTGFEIYANHEIVMKVTSSGLEVVGKIEATSGSIGNLTINNQLTFGGNEDYFINPNYNDGSYYIYLPGFRVDEASGAVFSGKLSAPSGTIGGFTLSTIALTAGTWGSDNSVMLSTGSTASKSIGGSASISGWAITAGSAFGVTKHGDLYASTVHVTGDINATSGNFEYCTIDETCEILGYVHMSGNEQVKFYGTIKTMYYDTWIGGTGTVSDISATPRTGSYKTSSYAYTRPFGMTVVPVDYSTSCDDGMIFGVMQTYSFKTQNLLAGASYYFKNDGTDVYSEVMIRCGDSTIIDAIANTATNKYNLMLGSSLFTENYLYGKWTLYDRLTFSGPNTAAYIDQITLSSVVYPVVYGIWYVQNSITFGISTTAYHVRHDADQITFYYGTKECGDIECYSSYVDIQGTWKTNGNNWISSSDRNLKKDIQDVDDVYGLIFDKLRPVSFKWKAGTSDRTHIGFIAQDVKEATEESGLTTKQFGAYVHFDASEKDGVVIPETCGIRYEEITPLNTWEIQKLKRRVAELEQKLEELKNEDL